MSEQEITNIVPISTPNDFLAKKAAECEVYYNSTKKDKVNWLIYGDYGTGKTTLLTTAIRPIYVFSFDPGGCTVLEDMPPGSAVLDTAYEIENRKHPSAFSKWETTYQKLKQSDAFSRCGTVVIDSLTNFGEALMNHIIAKAGRPDTTPQIQDYYTLQAALRDIISDCTNLPCDFILTAHIGTDKDQLTGRLIADILIPGKAAPKFIPLQFSEVLVTLVTDGPNKKPHYGLLTAPQSYFKARTRIGRGGKFELVEEPDLCALRAKAGKPITHLPNLT